MNRRLVLRVLVFFVLGGAFLPANDVLAQLQVCNSWENDAWVALGYKQDGEWVARGWWTVPIGGCITPEPAPLARPYYYYAIDAEGGYWKGDYSLCATVGPFYIEGDNNCRERGFVDQGFTLIDARSRRTVTVYLTEEDYQPPPKKIQRYGNNETLLTIFGIAAVFIIGAAILGGAPDKNAESCPPTERWNGFMCRPPDTKGSGNY